MIDATLFLPYLIAALLCIATPGIDSLGTLTIGLSRGRSAAMAFACGVGLGCLTHTLWATLGIAAIVASSEALFSAIKYIGAVYLVWLGIAALRSGDGGLIATLQGSTPISATNQHPTRASQFMLQGFVSNSLNPKVMLFFMAFLPQFVSTQIATPVWSQMLAMGLIFAVLTAAMYVAMGYVSGSVAAVFQRNPNVMVWINRISGLVFIGLAVKLAFTERRT